MWHDHGQECSICLSHQNVYICLVCGTYLHVWNPLVVFLVGEGREYACLHALAPERSSRLPEYQYKEVGAILWLQNRFYCVPDNYEIVDPYLDDIKAALDPEFSKSAFISFS